MDGNAKKKRKNRNNSATGVTTGETGVLTAKRNVKTIAQTLKAINGRDFTYNDVKLLQGAVNILKREALESDARLMKQKLKEMNEVVMMNQNFELPIVLFLHICSFLSTIDFTKCEIVNRSMLKILRNENSGAIVMPSLKPFPIKQDKMKRLGDLHAFLNSRSWTSSVTKFSYPDKVLVSNTIGKKIFDKLPLLKDLFIKADETKYDLIANSIAQPVLLESLSGIEISMGGFSYVGSTETCALKLQNFLKNFENLKSLTLFMYGFLWYDKGSLTEYANADHDKKKQYLAMLPAVLPKLKMLTLDVKSMPLDIMIHGILGFKDLEFLSVPYDKAFMRQCDLSREENPSWLLRRSIKGNEFLNKIIESLPLLEKFSITSLSWDKFRDITVTSMQQILKFQQLKEIYLDFSVHHSRNVVFRPDLIKNFFKTKLTGFRGILYIRRRCFRCSNCELKIVRRFTEQEREAISKDNPSNNYSNSSSNSGNMMM